MDCTIQNGNLVIIVPLASISPPKEDANGTPGKYAMIHSPRSRGFEFMAESEAGPIHGSVMIGIPVEKMPDEVAQGLGIDKEGIIAARLAAGATINRGGAPRKGAVDISSLFQAKKPTLTPAAKLAVAQAATNRRK